MSEKVSTVKTVQMIGVIAGILAVAFGGYKIFVLDNYKIGELEAATTTITVEQKEHASRLNIQALATERLEGKIDVQTTRINAQGKILEQIWDKVKHI